MENGLKLIKWKLTGTLNNEDRNQNCKTTPEERRRRNHSMVKSNQVQLAKQKENPKINCSFYGLNLSHDTNTNTHTHNYDWMEKNSISWMVTFLIQLDQTQIQTWRFINWLN